MDPQSRKARKQNKIIREPANLTEVYERGFIFGGVMKAISQGTEVLREVCVAGTACEARGSGEVEPAAQARWRRRLAPHAEAQP